MQNISKNLAHCFGLNTSLNKLEIFGAANISRDIDMFAGYSRLTENWERRDCVCGVDRFHSEFSCEWDFAQDISKWIRINTPGNSTHFRVISKKCSPSGDQSHKTSTKGVPPPD